MSLEFVRLAMHSKWDPLNQRFDLVRFSQSIISSNIGNEEFSFIEADQKGKVEDEEGK